MGKAADFRFARRARLRRRREFVNLFKSGKRAGDGRLDIWALPNDLGYSRLGLIVGRRHGNAVRRNRIKRIIREAFRQARPQLPRGLDIACSPRVGAKIELPETIGSLLGVTRRLERLLRQD
jgi:ribonuclease P protein component